MTRPIPSTALRGSPSVAAMSAFRDGLHAFAAGMRQVGAALTPSAQAAWLAANGRAVLAGHGLDPDDFSVIRFLPDRIDIIRKPRLGRIHVTIKVRAPRPNGILTIHEKSRADGDTWPRWFTAYQRPTRVRVCRGSRR
jgi:hypothetical protein